MDRLEIENATAYYDDESQLIRIQYSGALGGQVTVDVYQWIGKLVEEIGVEAVRGEIFDFRDVTTFMPDNLMEARRKSRGFNLRNDISHLPVAMVIGTAYHEEILRGPMQNPPENARKTIVYSEEEAVQFIEEWHTANTQED